MYTAHLFVVGFAILVATAASEGFISTKINGKSISMPTDELCTNAGFVKVPKPTIPEPADSTTTFKPTNHTPTPSSTLAPTPSPTLAPTHDAAAHVKTGNGMSTINIVLTVLGVTAGVLLLAFLGNYFYNKQKIH